MAKDSIKSTSSTGARRGRPPKDSTIQVEADRVIVKDSSAKEGATLEEIREMLSTHADNISKQIGNIGTDVDQVEKAVRQLRHDLLDTNEKIHMLTVDQGKMGERLTEFEDVVTSNPEAADAVVAAQKATEEEAGSTVQEITESDLEEKIDEDLGKFRRAARKMRRELTPGVPVGGWSHGLKHAVLGAVVQDVAIVGAGRAGMIDGQRVGEFIDGPVRIDSEL